MIIDPFVLCSHINEAFDTLAYPGDDRLIHKGSEEDYRHVKGAFLGLHWRDMPLDSLSELSDALYDLTPESFRFYLPAYMIFAVIDFPRAQRSFIPGRIINSLTLPDIADFYRLQDEAKQMPELHPDPEQAEIFFDVLEENYRSGSKTRDFFERVSDFTTPQRIAIRQFLEYMRDVHTTHLYHCHNPNPAIDRYWCNF